jgi:O-antigen ligase
MEVISSRSRLGRVTFYGIFGLLGFGPLAFGAVEPWSLFILQAGAAVLFAIWVLQHARSGAALITWNPLFPPLLAFGCLIILQQISGQTAYRYATYSQALRYTTYAVLCFLVVQTLRRSWQIKTLVYAFSGYGAALAIFAVLQSMTWNGKLYWLRAPRWGGWIYGPYVNHNHYAGLMEMLLPIPLIFSLTQYARGPRKIWALAAASVMAGTIFLSGSRGGMIAFSVQMTFLLILMVRHSGVGKTAKSTGIFLVLLLGIVIWLGSGELLERVESFRQEAHSELAGGTRIQISRDAFTMFVRKPVLGWGLGTFPEVYPQFRSFSSSFFINQTHNDYLQFLVETGTVGFLILGWFVVALYRNALKRIRNWQHDTASAVTLAALLGCTGILVHSLVDFNLQIPANAALFYVLSVMAVLRQPFGQSRSKAAPRTAL